MIPYIIGGAVAVGVITLLVFLLKPAKHSKIVEVSPYSQTKEGEPISQMHFSSRGDKPTDTMYAFLYCVDVYKYKAVQPSADGTYSRYDMASAHKTVRGKGVAEQIREAESNFSQKQLGKIKSFCMAVVQVQKLNKNLSDAQKELSNLLSNNTSANNVAQMLGTGDTLSGEIGGKQAKLNKKISSLKSQIPTAESRAFALGKNDVIRQNYHNYILVHIKYALDYNNGLAANLLHYMEADIA